MSSTALEPALSILQKLTDELSSTLPFRGVLDQVRRMKLPRFEWPALRIGDLEARVPVVQGGMGVGISLSKLAAAVANAGGIGVIAANAIGMIERDYFKDGREANLRALRREIRAAREASDGVIGVNIMVAVNDFKELLDVAIEEKIDLVIMGAGLPIKGIPVAKMRANGVKAVPIVSSIRATELIFRMWKKAYNDVPDAIVFEGPLAGGHIGFSEDQVDDPDYQLEAIVPGIVEAVRPYEEEYGRAIPVIAAGGVFTGEDIEAAMRLGASGVQMGTRFVATDECDAADEFKKAYVDCSREQIGLIKSPVGMPGRAIRNQFIVDSETGRRPSFRCAWQCLSSCGAEEAQYCISIALNNARKGRIDKGFVFCGANAYRVEAIVPVVALISELSEGYRVAARQRVARRLDGLVTGMQGLKRQYETLGTNVREAGAAYEAALADWIRQARDTGIDQLRQSYDTLLARLRDLQFQIAEGLAESWALLSPLRSAR